MRYKLIIFDIDGTITEHVSSWQLIHEKLNIWNEFASGYQDRFLAGKISYKKFCELDAACWKGLPEKQVAGLFNPLAYTKNARACVKRLKRLGFKLAAVSTGLQYTGERLKHELSLDYILTNRLFARNGILTGRVKIDITHGRKCEVVKNILKTFKVRAREAIGVGDSEGDISLLRNTGYSIAFNSISKPLSDMADYNCRTRDFKELYQKILDISF
jgi:HAD superfamily PSPase-like hydrolase